MRGRFLFFLLSSTCVSLIACVFFYSSVRAADTGVVRATITISVCGNGVIESGEQCDGSALGGQTCQILNLPSGSLRCSPGCIFDTSPCGSGNSGGGGSGGGGSSPTPATGAVFSGSAAPFDLVTLLQDGQIAGTVRADAVGQFTISVTGLVAGHYTFSLSAQDSNGSRSPLLNFPIQIGVGTTTNTSGIVIVPSSIATSPVTAADASTQTPVSSLVGDANGDGHVDLIDFSIAAYWYDRSEAPPAHVDLNQDGKVDLIDFSILAFHWTG